MPAGVLVLLGVPALWDFASSGLETGLAVGWIGACAWALSHQARIGNRHRQRPELPLASAVLLGLGPLIRPELALYSLAFGVAAAHLSDPGRRHRLTRLGAYLALPVAYQIFRMGFFATLVPNTALAKDATDTLWGRGLRYFGNFAGAYALVVPAVALIALVVISRPWRANRAWTTVAVALVVPAVLHTVYVIGIGGDYMHGRFFVVPLVALCAPVAVVALRLSGAVWRFQVAVLTALVGWALISGVDLRPPPSDGIAIDDQRALVVAYTHHQHPVRVGDQPDFLQSAGRDLRARARGDVFADRLDLIRPDIAVLPRARGAGPAAKNDAIGVAGWLLGTDVDLIDPAGLADPVAARQPTSSDVRAGSAHSLDPDWLAAVARVRRDHLSPGAVQAERALRCGALARFRDDVDDPLTAGRFLGNLADAFANTTLSVPASPEAAVRKFCGR